MFVKKLLDDVPMIALLDTSEILEYDAITGSYKKETMINQALNSRLGVLFQKRYADECRAVVLGTSAIDRVHLNVDANLINCKNGVYDSEKKVLLSHDPKYRFTYCLPFAYDPTARPERFWTFLADVCSGDLRIMIGVLEGFAYTFVPGYPIQRANMLVGAGSNGKGTLLNVLKAFVGPDNCEHLTLQTITRETSFALARLQGRLLNIGPDLPTEGLHDAGNFKALTGGDTLSADVKYVQNAVKLINSAKLWFSANTIPRSPEDTDAYYRRWNIWRLSKTFPEGNNILPELTTARELSGIFNLVLDILPMLKKNLRYTFACDAETSRKDYLKSADTVQLFADECLTYDPECNVPKSELYEGYVAFCKNNGLIPVKDNAFWRSLSKKTTYRENTPVRDGPRYAKGQRFALPETEQTVKLTPGQVVEKIRQTYALQQEQQDKQVISLLLYYISLLTPQTTIREYPAEPAEPDAEMPKTLPISQTVSESRQVQPQTPEPLNFGSGSIHDRIKVLIDSDPAKEWGDGSGSYFALFEALNLNAAVPDRVTLGEINKTIYEMERAGEIFKPRNKMLKVVRKVEC